MKVIHYIASYMAVFVFALSLLGCGHKGGDGHDHVQEGEHSKEDGHGHAHGGESESSASFKEGKGVIISEESKKLLGIEVTDVEQRSLRHQIRFSAQVFVERHRHLQNQEDHSGCDVHCSGFVTTNVANFVSPYQLVTISRGSNESLKGIVLAVQKVIGLGESEIVVGVSNAVNVLTPGEFVQTTVWVPKDDRVTAIPASALLRSSEGTFAYVVNGDAYLRTVVKVGVETEDWVEISEGLLAGDQLVIKPVQTLWLIELRATKGGGHSH